MTKKFLIGLAPLVVTAAFVMLPAVSQGFETCTGPNCPHVYKNGTIGAEAKPVREIAWGTLKLHNEKLGDVECHNIFAGFAENPAGGGAAGGKVQAFYPYECVDAVCTSAGGELKVKAGTTLPWVASAQQAKPGEFWQKTGFKGPTPNKKANPLTEPGQIEFNINCTVIGAPDFFGENDTLAQNNGVSIGSVPGELQFFHESENVNSHNLESELFGPGETLGKVKVQGYGSQELIEVKNP